VSGVLYPAGREGILDESIGMKSGAVRVMLVKSSYRFNPEHKFIDDLGAVDNGHSAPLKGKTFVDGVFDADDTVVVAAETAECNALVYFHPGTTRLVAYVDGAAGLPVHLAAGQRVTIEHDNGQNRIFRL